MCTHLVKEEHFNQAIDALKNTGIKITDEGRCHLGSPLCSKEYITKAVEEKVKEWCREVENLSAIAATQSRVAYSHGQFGKWTYWLRTCAVLSLYWCLWKRV